MKLNFIYHLLKIKSAAIMFCLLFFVAGISAFAHTVTGYSTNCGTGPTYSIDATVTNVNSSSNYAWQYKNTSNVWVCLVNGNNTINGNVYNLSGAASSATVNPVPLTFTNPNSSLNGLVIRCVISDGAGVNPCNVPVNNTWNSDAASVNLIISVSNSACGSTNTCSCPGNLVINPSFENGTYGWGSSGGNFNAGTGAVFCGNYSGDFQITNTASNWVSQTIGTDLAVGTVITANVYAGVHDNSFYAYVRVAFFDAAWNSLGASVNVEVNKVLAASPVGPQLYNITATVPPTAKYTQVVYGANGNWIKTDNWCVTLTAPPTCTGKVTSLYFNELSGGTDLPITNGSSFTIAQLGSLFNFEAATSGTVGSIKYTINGPSLSSNIENSLPYNSPGTGNGAWTGTAGMYSVNLKTYNNINGTGNLCHDTTFAFNLSSGSCTPTVTVISPVGNTACTNTFEYRICQPSCGHAISHWIIGLPPCFSSSNIAGVYVNGSIYNNWEIITDPTCDFFGLKVDNLSFSEGSCFNVKIVYNSNYTVGTNNWSDKAGVSCYFGGLVASPLSCTTCSTNASLGDFVWNDANGNGIQDAGEVGLSGVTVQLKNTAGTVIATTTTNSNGYYQFTGITPGTYTVQFLAVSGFGVSPANVGTNDAIDSDVNATGSVTVTLAAGESKQTIDAGFSPTTLAVGDRVFADLNNNGVREANETGIAGVTVNIYQDANNDNIADGAAFATATTNSIGNYLFSNLTPGNYIIGAINPAGYASSSVNGGDPDNNIDLDDNGQTAVGNETRGLAITLAGGTEPDGSGATNTNTNITYDFGFTGTGSIGDFVFNDTNGNGIQDAGETGIAGVNVTLTYPNGTTVFTTTNATGNYNFPNLPPGTTYSVSFTTPAGYLATQSNIGANDNVDSDPVAGVVINVTVIAGTANTSVDAGFYQNNLNLGNSVWYDKNNDGIKQNTETGIAGATVKLYADANNDNVADGAPTATTITTADGSYSFVGLVPGNYIVGVIIPTGYAIVTTNGGDPDNDIDNDNNGTNTSVAGEVRTSAISLITGTEPTADGDGNNGNLTADIGLIGTGSIGNFVWNDLNRNGIQDAGEPGLPNVTVILTYPDGGTTNVITDANGGYSFKGLIAASYNLSFATPPGGYIVSPSNVGSNDEIDSDPVNGTVSNIVLSAGEINNSVDAGFIKLISLTGNVWHDVNGLSDNLVNNSGASATPPAASIPVGLRAYLVNNATGLVETVAFVSSSTNTFTFPNVTANTNYYIILSNTQALVGNPPPAASLPTGWQNTGEKLGAGTGSDGIINGRLNVPVGTTNITNANFGIKLKSGEVVIG